MNDYLKIGLIQPVIDPEICWNKDGTHKAWHLNIKKIFAERVWQEIQNGLRLILKSDIKPDIILIPELHLPNSKINEIINISIKYNVMIITGLDFYLNTITNKIRNRGLITIPNTWGNNDKPYKVNKLFFGKSYFTYMEREMFKNIEGKTFLEDPEQNMYIFQSEKYGNFGIMICSDIFDIERMMLYQTKIHHLFIISLNKDLNTYFSMAESLTRLLYCNVVICNTGHYGGSLAISPYDNPNDRLIYKYYGQKMFNTQVVSIPVSSLEEAQRFDFSKDKKMSKIKFKASPPGYYDKIIN